MLDVRCFMAFWPAAAHDALKDFTVKALAKFVKIFSPPINIMVAVTNLG